MATAKNCPGAAVFKGAQGLKTKNCPECGGEIEIFSRDTHAVCSCGFVAYNDSQSCIRWCAHARECVGDEIYEAFIDKTSATAATQAAADKTKEPM